MVGCVVTHITAEGEGVNSISFSFLSLLNMRFITPFNLGVEKETTRPLPLPQRSQQQKQGVRHDVQMLDVTLCNLNAQMLHNIFYNF